MSTIHKNKNAFTLAEVLITIAVIGIVAAMSIPGLIASSKEKELITNLKKTYSDLNQAYSKIKLEHGDPGNWNVTNLVDIANYFAPYLNTTYACKVEGSCHPHTGIKDLRKNTSNVITTHFKLTNGVFISIWHQISVASGLTCTGLQDMCFIINADVNGEKPPNRYGVDIFTFQATKDYIRPRGALGTHGGSSLCNPTGDTGTAGWWNGTSCSGWVLLYENMDYLKCIDEGQADYCHTYSVNSQ